MEDDGSMDSREVLDDGSMDSREVLDDRKKKLKNELLALGNLHESNKTEA